MSMLSEVAAYLTAHSLGTLGTDMYLHRLQDVGVPALAVCLFQRPGRPGIRTHDIAGVAYEQPDLSIMVRGGPTQYATAMTRAQDITDALAEVTNTTLSGVRYLSIDVVTPPEDAGVDSHARPLILARFAVTKEVS